MRRCATARAPPRSGRLLPGREVAGAAHRRVPVVALHVAAAARDRRARDVVARTRIAREEAARRRRHELRLLRRHARAFGVGDLRIGRERGVFGAAGDFDRFVGGQIPRVKQVEIARRGFEQLGFGEARAVVFGGEARDVVGRRDRVSQRLRRKVGGARVAALLADVHRHADHLVAVVLDRLDFAAPHRDRQAVAFGDFGRRVAAAERLRVTKDVRGDFLQFILGMRKKALLDVHVCCHCRCRPVRGRAALGVRTCHAHAHARARWFTHPAIIARYAPLYLAFAEGCVPGRALPVRCLRVVPHDRVAGREALCAPAARVRRARHATIPP